jgi:hypothetical protein
MSGLETIPNLEEFPREPLIEAPTERPSVSVFRKRVRKFRTIKRGYCALTGYRFFCRCSLTALH